MTVYAPERVWWRPLGAEERLYVVLAAVFAIGTFLLMPVWHLLGSQNAVMRSYRVEPAAYQAKVETFIQQYRVGEDGNLPVVAPPPGGDIYLQGRMWQWLPVLKLKANETYRLHLSSTDVLHGFSLKPMNMNFMVTPGYEYVLEIRPTSPGVYNVVCNEFCGIGHHLMVGKIIVE